MRMAVEKPDLALFSYKFQGIFNVTVFSELAHHTKTKMIIFTIGLLQGFRLFQVNRNEFSGVEIIFKDFYARPQCGHVKI